MKINIASIAISAILILTSGPLIQTASAEIQTLGWLSPEDHGKFIGEVRPIAIFYEPITSKWHATETLFSFKIYQKQLQDKRILVGISSSDDKETEKIININPNFQRNGHPTEEYKYHIEHWFFNLPF